MFINIDENYLLNSLLGPESTNEVLSPEEGMIIGNLFYNTYEPYKHYLPPKLVAYSEQEQLLLKIQALDFAVNDLGLYLDLYPQDQMMYEKYRRYASELKKACDIYGEKYEALEIGNDLKESYTWNKGPWPWEDYHV